MPARHARSGWADWTAVGARRVPEITATFWIVKALSTAFGEATSDYLVARLGNVPAVGLGFALFVVVIANQFRLRRYTAWGYWGAVCAVGVFGTMAADVLHKGFGVPYAISTALYAVALAVVFVAWARVEHSLSIHDIVTGRREAFYWLAVCATFAMGTALGDLTATTVGIGYLSSIAVFAVLIAVPAVGYRFLGWGGVFSFWFAYVVTRPLGASVADALGKAKDVGGEGIGDGWVALVSGLVILAIVAGLARRRSVAAAVA